MQNATFDKRSLPKDIVSALLILLKDEAKMIVSEDILQISCRIKTSELRLLLPGSVFGIFDQRALLNIALKQSSAEVTSDRRTALGIQKGLLSFNFTGSLLRAMLSDLLQSSFLRMDPLDKRLKPQFFCKTPSL